MFWGMLIKMYYAPGEHNPPHIHVEYQEFEASFNIRTGAIDAGKMPRRQTRLVQAWIEIHREDLLADWKLCQDGLEPMKIEPLK
ncbi:hypothetical protein AGMMS4957_13540 [Bacteroidia bacterium]|nr:hypothetical protein AGMMS4957_13540 [Bacteroidia bacterium]